MKRSLPERVGAVAFRFPWATVAVWFLVALVGSIVAPLVSSATRNQADTYLASDAPSVIGSELETGLGPAGAADNVIVVANPNEQLTSADLSRIAALRSTVRHVPNVIGVDTVIQSRNRRAILMLVDTDVDSYGDPDQTKAIVDEIRHDIASTTRHSGLQSYLTGDLASAVDEGPASAPDAVPTALASAAFILLLLLLVLRSLPLALVVILPAVAALFLTDLLIALFSRWGLPVSDLSQAVVLVIVLAAGTDYGLILVQRAREETRRGQEQGVAIMVALATSGRAIALSGFTAVTVFVLLILTGTPVFGGLAASLLVTVASLLAAYLSLIPALLQLLGTCAARGTLTSTLDRRTHIRAEGRYPYVLRHAGVIVFVTLGALAALSGLASDFSSGFENGVPQDQSGWAKGNALIESLFPPADASPTRAVFLLPAPVQDYPPVLYQLGAELGRARVFSGVSGPLDANGTHLTPYQWVELRRVLGPANKLSIIPKSGTPVGIEEYEAYRASAQYLSSDGHIAVYDVALVAGPAYSQKAISSVPEAMATVRRIGSAVGTEQAVMTGSPATEYDVMSATTNSVPVILGVALTIFLLIIWLATRRIILSLLVVASVLISYVATLGLVAVISKQFGDTQYQYFELPVILLILLIAFTADYNILFLKRVEEESETKTALESVTCAMGTAGKTVTSAGIVLAGTFLVLAAVSEGPTRQVALGCACGVALDALVVRALLLPAGLVLIDRFRASRAGRSSEEVAPTGATAPVGGSG